jgi:hypothetical protein
MQFAIEDNLDCKFELGRVVSTPGALNAFGPEFLGRSLARHMSGDWGDIDPSDAELNQASLKDGNRVLSSYKQDGKTLWIITDAVGETGHREVTTFLLPSEY